MKRLLLLILILLSGPVLAADSWIQMPSDAANTGKKSATISKTDGADTVHVSRSTIEDATTLNQLIVTATGAAKVDGSAVTQPVSLASVPTHAVTMPNVIQAISITTSTGTQQLAMNGLSGCGLQILGVGTGGVLVFEGSGDGTNWAGMTGIVNSTGLVATGTSAVGQWQFDCTSVPYFRVRATALTSGTITGLIIGAANSSIVNLENPIPAGANVIGAVSLGNATGKTNVMRTGSLVTTAVTADQVVLTYTVTAGKTFYMEYLRVDTRLTTMAATATNFGLTSLENPAATKLITQMQGGTGITTLPPMIFAEPIPIAAGTVIRVVCTPATTTSYTWQANFGGYEK